MKHAEVKFEILAVAKAKERLRPLNSGFVMKTFGAVMVMQQVCYSF